MKQGMAAIALVVSLGLIVPGSFGGSASADVSRKWGLQPMAIACDLNGDAADGNEYVSEVMSADKEFTNAHTTGFQVFKMATLQDVNSSLVFVAQSGSVETTYTAIDHDFDAETNPQDITRLADDDPRLAGGYPAVFSIPPGHPYSYFDEDGFSIGKSTNKQNLVDCVVTDVGASDDGFQNWYPAGESDAAVTDCVVDGAEQGLCFKPPVLNDDGELVSAVAYHYTDTFTIEALVTNNGGAKAKSASADDDTSSADRQVKAKKGGKHRGKGKHRK
jgi:hypothetical protein